MRAWLVPPGRSGPDDGGRRQKDVILVQSVFARDEPVTYDDVREMWKIVRPGDVMEKR